MKILSVVAVLVLGSAAHAQAQENRWVTFKTGHNNHGPLEHQIDRNSIRQEGGYKSFWTQIWVVREKQALVFSVNEKLFFWSQKFLVDCGGRRFGASFVDTNHWKEEKLRATPQTVRWESLDKFPAVAKTVCGEK
jgi:hypothetical protein